MSTASQNSPTGSVPYYVVALAMALPAIMLGLQISGWIFFMPGAMQGHADFRQLYAAGYMVRTGHSHELFDYASQKHFQDMVVSPEQIALPFIRPAYQALVFVPFSLVPYRVAYFLFLALNIVLFGFSFSLLRSFFSNLATIWDRFPEAMYISFLPAGAALMQEQDSILLLLLLSGAWVQLNRKSLFSAGILLGSCLFKFQIAIPIAILLLCWKHWRLFLGFVLTASVLAGVSVWMTGTAQAQIYLRSIFHIGSGMRGTGNELHYPQPMHLMMNLHALLYALMHGHAQPLTISVVTIVTTATLFLWIVWAGRARVVHEQFLIAVASAVLFSYYIFVHDLVVLEIPLLIALNHTIFSLWGSPTARRLLPAVCVVLFAAPTLVVTKAYLLSLPLALFIYLLLSCEIPLGDPAHP